MQTINEIGQITSQDVVLTASPENMWLATHAEHFGPGPLERRFRRSGHVIVWNAVPSDDDMHAVENHCWMSDAPPFDHHVIVAHCQFRHLTKHRWGPHFTVRVSVALREGW